VVARVLAPAALRRTALAAENLREDVLYFLPLTSTQASPLGPGTMWLGRLADQDLTIVGGDAAPAAWNRSRSRLSWFMCGTRQALRRNGKRARSREEGSSGCGLAVLCFGVLDLNLLRLGFRRLRNRDLEKSV
jgi:hypothetical protein